MNPWFGPYPADLIRLGAKFTPCIRRHDQVEKRFEQQLQIESLAGCCIDETTSRCMQTLPQQCLVSRPIDEVCSSCFSSIYFFFRNVRDSIGSKPH